MGKIVKVSAAVSIAVLLAAGLVFYFHQPPKPVSHSPVPVTREFVGVGLMLRSGPGSDAIIVQQAVPNSPAAEAHIASGMMVNKVDGVSLEGKPLAECVNLIRGPVGTTVRLELITADHSQTNTVELTRKKISL